MEGPILKRLSLFSVFAWVAISLGCRADRDPIVGQWKIENGSGAVDEFFSDHRATVLAYPGTWKKQSDSEYLVSLTPGALPFERLHAESMQGKQVVLVFEYDKKADALTLIFRNWKTGSETESIEKHVRILQ